MQSRQNPDPPGSTLAPTAPTALRPGTVLDAQPDAVILPELEARPAVAAAVPPGVVDITCAAETRRLWPYTTAQFPARRQDPLNLIFVGRCDPRNVRAALLALDGERDGFLPALAARPPLFSRTWRDAIGGIQAAYSEAGGWTGSALQLECGDYGSLRFHIRLFSAGGWTVANAHLDVLIPGTADHEVVAWELARQFVVYDFQRSGLLDPFTPVVEVETFHPPVFRTIDPRVFAQLGELTELLLQTDSILPDGQLRCRGTASLLALAGSAPAPPPQLTHEVVLQLGQVMPRPFGSAAGEYVRVDGAVSLRQKVYETAAGSLLNEVQGTGELRVTPLDPRTREPAGEAARARVREHHAGVVTDGVSWASMSQERRLLAEQGAGEWEQVDLRVGPKGDTYYSHKVGKEEERGCG